MATNIGHLYYKQYFSRLKLHKETGKPKLDSPINDEIYKLSLGDYSNLINDSIKEHHFDLTTVYPGLLVGSGYIHEVGGKEIESELKLGFYFDHTTGLPVIPGSSVKGLLRSAFKKAEGDYVKELIESLGIDCIKSVAELDKAIFEGETGASIYNRDVFFDAYPVVSKNKNKTFFANDYITHHENPLKNPNPIQFLKILPNVAFQFNFKLTNNGGLSADSKLELFKHILLDLGIGAKTNVGYGQFMISEKEKLKAARERVKRENNRIMEELEQKAKEKEASKTEAEKRLLKGTKHKCRVVDITKKEVFFMFDWDAELKFKKMKRRFSIELEINNIVEIEIIDDFYIRQEVLFSNTITII